MSEAEEPLLDDEGELTTARWNRKGSARHRIAKGRTFALLFLATLSVALLAIFIIIFQWHSAFKAQETNASESHVAAALNGQKPERDLAIYLHPEDHVSREPTIRQFSWNITRGIIAPDGVQKEVYLINNQFPGPIIEARSGDILEVEVLNLLQEGISLHWHGLHMKGANDMDGPVGVTQCPIPPGENFAYRVPIGEQSGTFWYHAHSEVHRGDGLYGGLVIHNPNEQENIKYGYDKELLFLVGDWYHWPSARVLETFLNRDSDGIETCPDSLLINGLGYFQCSMAVPAAPVNCTEIQKPWLSLRKEDRYRIRLVNTGSLTGLSFTILDSELKVFQVDGGQEVDSQISNSVGVLYPAERVDMVVSWPASARNRKSEFTIQLDSEYFLRPNFALTANQSFAISPGSESESTASNENTLQMDRFNLRTAKGTPLNSPLPEAQRKFLLYTVVEVLAHQNYIPKGFINHTTWEPQSLPLVSLTRDEWNSHQLVAWTGSDPSWIELTINNVDGTGHPFHLHGFDFYIVGSHEGNGGWDYYNPYESKPPRGGPFNLINPLVKDTVYVPPYGYVVIRFRADNAGIWMLHCHVLWHQASGMGMAFQVLGDEQKGLSQSEAGQSAKHFCEAHLNMP